jgi:hypothetical protein
LISESLPPSMDTSTGMTTSSIPASSIPSRITLVDGSSRTPRLGEEESILWRSTLVVDSPRIGSLPHGFGEDVIAHSGLLISCCDILPESMPRSLLGTSQRSDQLKRLFRQQFLVNQIMRRLS